jgi:predicted MFS family arabinose efflux permease
MDAAWFAVLVLYVTQVLHQRSGAYGLLLAIAALGGIVTGAFGTRLTRRLGPWPSLVIAGLAMAGSQAGLGLNADVIIAAVLLFISSAAFALFNMTAVTMRQRLVPAGLLGRVSSLYSTVALGAEALGAIGGGTLAAAAGIRAPMLIGAVPIAALTAVLAWRHCRSAPGANSGAAPSP